MGRHALVVSSSRYSHPSLRPLSTPTQDAESLEELLRDRTIGEFRVRPVIDQPSWVVALEVEKWFAERSLDDLALFYFSGHGIKDEGGTLYFATMNTDPKALRSTTLPSENVIAAMRQCRSRQQVLILDCCYAGAFSRAMFAKGAERVGVQERFATGGAGRVVISASDAMQIALEGGSIEGESTLSVFTRAIVEGIREGAADQDGDGLISLDELYDYVYRRMTKDSPDQVPTISNIETKGDIVIALNPNITAPSAPPSSPPVPPSARFPPAPPPAVPEPTTPVAEKVLRTLRTHRRLSFGLGAGALAVAIAIVALTAFSSGSPKPAPGPRDEWSLADIDPAVFAGPRAGQLLTDVAALPGNEAAVGAGKNGRRPGVWTYNVPTTLTQETVERGTGAMRAVAAGAGTVIAVGKIDQTTRDVDGMVWRRSAAGHWTRTCARDICGGNGNQEILAAAPVAGGFIAVGRRISASGHDFDGAVWRSRDAGRTWERAANDRSLGGALNQSARGVVEYGSRIIAVGSSGRNGAVWVSADRGDTWTRLSPGVFTKPREKVELVAVAKLEGSGATGSRLIAVGYETNDTGKSSAAAWFSDDGRRWTKAAIRNARFSDQQMVALAAGPRGLVAVGNATHMQAAVWRSEDGRSWTGVTSDSFDRSPGMTGVALLRNETVVAVGTAIWLSGPKQ